MSGASHHGMPISHRFRLPFVHLVHLPFTFYACRLLAGNRLSRAKTPLCVTTMLVRVVTLFTLQQESVPEGFVGIATNSPCRSSCAGMVSLGDFGPVCYTRVDESSKTIAA